MAVNWAAAVTSAAEPLIAGGVVPGLVVLVQEDGRDPQILCLGADRDGTPLEAGTLFPVASITKLATALAVLRLVAQGRVALDEPLSRYLPEAAAAVEGVMPRALLCHTSGLPDDLPPGSAPYALGLDWPAIARACLGTPLIARPWTQVNYSNTGFGLLAVIVERLVGMPFPAALPELVLAPLGIEGYFGQEPSRRPAQIVGDWGEHLGTPLEPYNSPFWRSLARPYSGLVTTAAGANLLVQAFAGRTAVFLPPALLAEATRDQTGGLPGHLLGLWDWERAPWGLGVELRGLKTPHAVAGEASPGSFGHLGASGCLAWYDPSAGIAWGIFGPRLFFEWWTHMPAISTAILTCQPHIR